MEKIAAFLVAVLCPLLLPGALDKNDPRSPGSGDFARAIRANDLSALKVLGATSSAANVTDKLKATPLHYAAIYGSPEAVRILLSAGADPKARNQAGASPLLYAAWSLDKTRLLVENGAEVNRAANDGTTALMVAASEAGNIATVRYLIEKGADVRALDGHGGSALLRSASMSDPEILRLLLAHGADPHLADAVAFTPLHSATAFPDCERIKLLLAAGVDPNGFNSFAGTVRKGPLALVHLSPLMLASAYADEDTIAALLKAGARVNESDIRKMTPLMLSITTDHANPAVVRRLIAAGADVNAKDANGEAVLTWARKYRNPEILSILEAAGAQGAQLSPAPQPEAGAQAANAREAFQRALPLLASSGPQFFREGGCAGCHHQPFHARVFAAATHAGLSPNPSLRQNFLDAIVATRPLFASSLPVLTGPGGDYDVLLAYVMSFADLGEPASDLTDLIVHYVAVRQHSSGAWVNLGLARPPIEDSTITRTAMAIRALKLYSWPARQAEFEERIHRARLWLENATPITTYERADKIAGLQAAGVPASDLRRESAALLQMQRPDGGWAQTPYLDSDAYATGMVLSTLYAAALVSPQDACYRKGVQFLLRTQFRDGSWYVRSRAPKFQPYFQSGFPFDHDQWISSAATSVALMALAPASVSEQAEVIRK
jgi:ankyrin repeat protein